MVLGVKNEAGQRLTEFCQENALLIANTLFQQHKRRLYTWTSPDGQHQNQTDTTLMPESEEELKSLLMKVKEESEKAGSTFRKLRSYYLIASLHGK